MFNKHEAAELQMMQKSPSSGNFNIQSANYLNSIKWMSTKDYTNTTKSTCQKAFNRACFASFSHFTGEKVNIQNDKKLFGKPGFKTMGEVPVRYIRNVV